MISELTDSERTLIDVDVKLSRDGTPLDIGLTNESDTIYTTTMKVFGLSGNYSCLTTAKPPSSSNSEYLNESSKLSFNNIIMRAGSYTDCCNVITVTDEYCVP